MALAAEKEFAHIGESSGMADHDHDLVHELGKRLDAYWRYDQFLANSKGHPALVQFWQDVKKQDEENIKTLRRLVADEIKMGCF